MFDSQLVKTDVTAIKLFNNHILAGVGNFLLIFDNDGALINKKKIFNGHKIYGIEIKAKKILVHGGCHIQILNYDFNFSLNGIAGTQIGDWILTSRWIGKNKLAVVVMNNQLILYDESLKLTQRFFCEDKCILYSALIIHEQNDQLVVLSGTVFGEILIWATWEAEHAPVLVRLQGHNGVIFSLSYNKSAGYICSTSDDRCSILWAADHKCIVKELKRKSPQVRLINKFYGHQSRIFRSLVLDDLLVTAGEDSHINIWNFNGELLRTMEINQSGPIWSLDCKDDVVVSGGGNCGILKSPLVTSPICGRLTMPENQVPKKIGFLLNQNVVAITENCNLYLYVCTTETWVKVGRHEDLKSYCLLKVSKCQTLLSLSGYCGQIYIYCTRADSLQLLASHQSENQHRICSFHWLTCQTFLTSQEGGNLSLYYLSNDKLIVSIANFSLPDGSKKDVYSSAACRIDNGRFLIGDRRGNLHLYKLSRSLPICTYKKAHDFLGITQLYKCKDRIISLGRDGNIKFFLTEGDKLDLVASDKLPFAWLGEFVNDRALLAFAGNALVFFDYHSRRILFKYVCGGGHRSWDSYIDDSQMTFIYVKDRAINLISVEERQWRSLSVVPDYHGNVINSIQVIELLDDCFMIVSGSEDTNLRVAVVGKDNFFHNVETFKSHLSSIRSVCVYSLSVNTHLVFSGGGRGQIICWKFTSDANKCIQEDSLYEKGSEMRIMDMKIDQFDGDLLLFAAFSDGTIKSFRVDQDENERYKLRLALTFSDRVRCISNILILNPKILIAMSTDGLCDFWILSEQRVCKSLKIHQSGIVASDFCFVAVDQFLILTGGDDGGVALNLFRIGSDSVPRLLLQFRDDFSHCAQISGAHFISGDRFLTTGLDQKLLLFRWSLQNDAEIACKVLARYDTAVADLQGMRCFDRGDCVHIFLYGKGVEYVKFVS